MTWILGRRRPISTAAAVQERSRLCRLLLANLSYHAVRAARRQHGRKVALSIARAVAETASLWPLARPPRHAPAGPLTCGRPASIENTQNWDELLAEFNQTLAELCPNFAESALLAEHSPNLANTEGGGRSFWQTSALRACVSGAMKAGALQALPGPILVQL